MNFKHIFGDTLIIYYFYVLWIVNVDGSTIKKRSLADNIHSGIQFAGKMLGIDAASEVANLVARAFATNLPKQVPISSNPFTNPNRLDEQQPLDTQLNSSNQGPGFIGNLLRIIGLDSGKIGALAVNGIIFLAQMIGRSLISSLAAQWQKSPSQKEPISFSHQPTFRHPPFQSPSSTASDRNTFQQRASSTSGSTPLDWILDNQSPTFQKLMDEVKDQNLPHRVEEMITSTESIFGETDCLKMLMCKSSPFVWGMQRAITAAGISSVAGDQDDNVSDDNVFNGDDGGGGNDTDQDDGNIVNDRGENRLDAFFKYLPDLNEFKENGQMCETKYEKCKINDK